MIGRSAPHLAQAWRRTGRRTARVSRPPSGGRARGSLSDCAGLALVVALIALWRWSRQQPAAPLAAVVLRRFGFFAFLRKVFSTALPLPFVRGPFDLAERLQARAVRAGSLADLRQRQGPAAPFRTVGSPLRHREHVAGPAAAVQTPSRASRAWPPVLHRERSGIRARIVAKPRHVLHLFRRSFRDRLPGASAPHGARAQLPQSRIRVLGRRVRAAPAVVRRRTPPSASGASPRVLAHVSRPRFDVRQEAVIRGDGLPDLVEGAAAAGRVGTDRARPDDGARARSGDAGDRRSTSIPVGARRSTGDRAPVAEVDLAALGVVLPPRK